MTQPLATLQGLKDRLEWTLDDGEERIAEGALEELSEDARFYGKSSWTSPDSAPRMVRNIVLKAAARWMRNPDGYITSRAGDETLGWSDQGDRAGSASFTDREIKQLRQLSGHSNMLSVPVTAWGTELPDNEIGYVPTGNDGDPFPLYASDRYAV